MGGGLVGYEKIRYGIGNNNVLVPSVYIWFPRAMS